MFEFPDDPDSQVFRAASRSWRSEQRTAPDEAWELLAPGRGALELSVLSAAFSIVVPLAALIAVPSAWIARRAGNRRGAVMLAMSAWCLVLGIAFRGLLGIGVVP